MLGDANRHSCSACRGASQLRGLFAFEYAIGCALTRALPVQVNGLTVAMALITLLGFFGAAGPAVPLARLIKIAIFIFLSAGIASRPGRVIRIIYYLFVIVKH